MSGLGEDVAAALRQLDAEMTEAETTPLRLISDAGAIDEAEWEYLMTPVAAAGETWLSAKWLTAEFYFYRRVLEATGYFQEGRGRLLDPFQNDKDKGTEQVRRDSSLTLRAATHVSDVAVQLQAKREHIYSFQGAKFVRSTLYLKILGLKWCFRLCALLRRN